MAAGEKKIPAGVLAILVGWLGVHKFYLGYTRQGVIQLVVGLVTCGSIASKVSST